MKKTIKYLEIAEEIMAEIRSGRFKAGEKLYSRSQLIEKYHVSGVTAVAVQDYLAAGGLVRKVRGGGIFLNYSSDSMPMKLEQNQYSDVKRIENIRFGVPSKNSVSWRYYNCLEEEAAARKVPYTTRILEPSEISETIPLHLEAEPGTGYIILGLGSLLLFHTASLLIHPKIPTVLINDYIQGSDCVLPDVADGVERLLNFAVEQGCRDFAFACPEKFSYPSVMSHAVWYHCRRLGFPCKLFEYSSYEFLLESLRREKHKTGVFFPSDEVAYRLKMSLAKKDLQKLLILGYGDYAGILVKQSPLTTIRPDYKAIAQKTIDLLLAKQSIRKGIYCIPGELIVRDQSP